MARPESVALGGYYPTPEHLLPRIARLLALEPAGEHHHASWSWPYVSFVDPCAADGAAVLGLTRALLVDDEVARLAAKVFAVELEATRADALAKRRGRDIAWERLAALHGDAFKVVWKRDEGASLLYLNPPYDHDPEHGRLEERFLARFVDVLCPGGVLVFVVPFYALKASAARLATHFSSLACFRFPDADFAAFKQVVLIGSRGPAQPQPDALLLEQVLRWSADPESIHELPAHDADATPVAQLPRSGKGLTVWEMGPLDLAAMLESYRPWHASDRGGRAVPVAGVAVETTDAMSLLGRRYPLATPPRPAHLAAAIAAGVFNGARVSPDDRSSGLPDLLVKGVFDREFVSVEEKVNKEGDVVGLVQVQQPRLVVTVLDLRERRYLTLTSSTERTSSRTVEGMTTADLIAAYGRSLMATMLEVCPVLHDPSDPKAELSLPPMARPLFGGQRHPAMAVVRLLGGLGVPRRARRGRAAFLLGEIGSGKSTVALAASHAIGARRTLVMCPPHLLDGWVDQIRACLPTARIHVLSSVDDVDAFATDAGAPVLGVLSREAAKLGHAWERVGDACPRCGAPTPHGDLARERARCSAVTVRAADRIARTAESLAWLLLPRAPLAPAVAARVQCTRHGHRLLARAAAQVHAVEERLGTSWGAPIARVRPLVAELARALPLVRSRERLDMGALVLEALLGAVNDDGLTAETVRELHRASLVDPNAFGIGARLREHTRALVLLMAPGALRDAALEGLRRDAVYAEEGLAVPWCGWAMFDRDLERLDAGEGQLSWELRRFARGASRTLHGHEIGSVALAVEALTLLTPLGRWTTTKPCGEPLFAAIPEPRRVPLAGYLAKRYPDSLDLFVLDEGHEYAGDGSAQGLAAHRITALGVPTVVLTGSVMNGYAESLFANQWALDPQFRQEFGRDDRAAFVRQYGYVKRVVEDRDKATGKVVTFGAVSDRVERSSRHIGHAPGVLPIFLLRYLLRCAVTLHKTDLALDLPPCRELVARVKPSRELRDALERLQRPLVAAIRRDSFGPLAGKLWGAMAELPSYLDRASADVGNGPDGSFTISYPENAGGRLVAREPGLPPSEVLPKERWMLDTIQAELAEGRRVLVFAWHVALLPRLQRIISDGIGEPCSLLDAQRVSASKRQSWIDREVIGRGRRVLVVNPVAVQTGLNNLVHFSTEIWMQNPGCNPIVYRQAVGRVDRIGQTRETRVYFPVYEGTVQEQLHRLLLHKVAVSQAADGLDAESALAAAGVGVSAGLEAMAVGRQLYELLTQGPLGGPQTETTETKGRAS